MAKPEQGIEGIGCIGVRVMIDTMGKVNIELDGCQEPGDDVIHDLVASGTTGS